MHVYMSLWGDTCTLFCSNRQNVCVAVISFLHVSERNLMHFPFTNTCTRYTYTYRQCCCHIFSFPTHTTATVIAQPVITTRATATRRTNTIGNERKIESPKHIHIQIHPNVMLLFLFCHSVAIHTATTHTHTRNSCANVCF